MQNTAGLQIAPYQNQLSPTAHQKGWDFCQRTRLHHVSLHGWQNLGRSQHRWQLGWGGGGSLERQPWTGLGGHSAHQHAPQAAQDMRTGQGGSRLGSASRAAASTPTRPGVSKEGANGEPLQRCRRADGSWHRHQGTEGHIPALLTWSYTCTRVKNNLFQISETLSFVFKG